MIQPTLLPRLVQPALIVLALLLPGAFTAVEAQSRSSRSADGPSAEDVDKAALLRMQAIQREYGIELSKVAAAVAKRGLVEEAKSLEKRIRELDAENPNLEKLAERIAAAEPVTDEEDKEKALSYLERRLEDVNEDQGKRLYGLAVACMRFGLFTKAYDMLLGALEVNPDDKKVRAALGYKQDRKTKEWITAWEYEMRKKHFLTPEGWFPKKDKRDFDKGLRPYQGKWIDKERERQIRGRSNTAPYAVESEHFTVKTNIGREKAWEIAQLLEDFYGEFFRTFIGYYDQVAGAKLLFNAPDAKRNHLVVIFPERSDYLLHVKEDMGNDPLLQRSGGFYSSRDRLSRFFWTEDDQQALSTLYHEVGHQLFAETKDTASGGSDGNNWVVEGIATYLETWKKVDGKWQPGGNLAAEPLQVAKQFLARSDDWKLAAFAALGHEEFHGKDASAQAQRSLHYNLAGALCHFFMHYDDEVYKEDFVQFLSDYYAGKVRKDSLGDKIRSLDGKKVSFEVLERQFREYLADLGSKKPRKSETSADAE